MPDLIQRAPPAGQVYADPEPPNAWSALETGPKPQQTAATDDATEMPAREAAVVFMPVSNPDWASFS